MTKLNIKIKINNLEQVKILNLNKISELNPEVAIEFGYNN